MPASSPKPGDLVRHTADHETLPGVVVQLDNRWTLVQWFENHHHAQPTTWSQWYPQGKLSVISSACKKIEKTT